MVIHQIWVGPNPMPLKWMGSWRKKNPDMGYSVWTNYRGFRYERKIKHLIDKGMYACATDIMRVEILYDEGGVYIDADSVCLKSIQDAPFINGFFAAKDYTDWVANGVIGWPKEHPILKRYLERIAGPHHYWEYGARMLTACLDDTATILPTCTFYPTNWKGNKAPVEGEIYAEQYWATTKGRYE